MSFVPSTLANFLTRVGRNLGGALTGATTIGGSGWTADFSSASTTRSNLAAAGTGDANTFSHTSGQTFGGPVTIDTSGGAKPLLIKNSYDVNTAAFITGGPDFASGTGIRIYGSYINGAASYIHTDYFVSEGPLVLGTYSNRASQLVLNTDGSTSFGGPLTSTSTSPSSFGGPMTVNSPAVDGFTVKMQGDASSFFTIRNAWGSSGPSDPFIPAMTTKSDAGGNPYTTAYFINLSGGDVGGYAPATFFDARKIDNSGRLTARPLFAFGSFNVSYLQVEASGRIRGNAGGTLVADDGVTDAQFGTIAPKSYTVATLPTPGTARRIAYASNARNAGEGAGVGTGSTVVDDGTVWKIPGIAGAVAA